MWVLLVLRNGEGLLASLLAKRADPNQDSHGPRRFRKPNFRGYYVYSDKTQRPISCAQCHQCAAYIPLFLYCTEILKHLSWQSDDSGVLLQLKRWSRFSSGRYLFMETSWSWDVTQNYSGIWSKLFCLQSYQPSRSLQGNTSCLCSWTESHFSQGSLWNALGRWQKGLC